MKEATRLDCLVAIMHVLLYNGNKIYGAIFCFSEIPIKFIPNLKQILEIFSVLVMSKTLLY